MRVRIIKPIEPVISRKTKTCAYVRVSTDSLSQADSLENQTAAYERLITSNPEYEFVGIYSDQGLTGCYENRPGFQKMMDEAHKGNIDLIITKSISRLARNTVTILKFARELKEIGVGIFFEEERINTLTSDGELMMTVMASFAQEESRSTSENIRWSMKKKFERGDFVINTKRFMGYDIDDAGDLVINPEEAEIVKRIFDLYLKGTSTTAIAKLFNKEGIPTVTGCPWQDSTINNMLRNEKYKGDFILQKYYTPEDKRNRTVRNRGELQSYYISENHPAIIPGDDWDKVQTILDEKIKHRNLGREGTAIYKKRYKFSGLLFCPYCGKALNRRYVHNRKVQWICSTYLKKGIEACKGIRAFEEDIERDIEKLRIDLTQPIVIEEIGTRKQGGNINGKKHYRYTSKSEYGEHSGADGASEKESGSVLQGFDRSRRTVVKL